MSLPIDENYVIAYTADGQLAGEMVRAFLESMGIPAVAIQESAGVTYGLTIGRLGESRVYVPEDRLDEAKDLLERMEKGEFDVPSSDDGEESEGEADS